MNISPVILRLLIVAALLHLFGCAANVHKTDGQGRSEALPKISLSPAASKKIFLAIGGSQTMTTHSDWQPFVDEWMASMTAATSSAGIAFSLLKASEEPPPEPATWIKVTVNDFRYMSQAKRYMVGVMFGNAFMDLNVEFVELPSRNVVGTWKYDSSTSGGQGIFSAATPKQVEAVATDIVKEVKDAGTAK